MSNNDSKNNESKLKKAIALGYDPEREDAPKVIASGKGDIAKQIIALAKEKDIPIHEDADLAEMLNLIEVNSVIPLEAYGAIAEILSYIYKENNQEKLKQIKDKKDD